MAHARHKHTSWAALLVAALVAALGAASPTQAAGRLALTVIGNHSQVSESRVGERLTQALEAEGLEVSAHGGPQADSVDEALLAASASGCDLLILGRVDVVGYRIDAELVESAAGRRLAQETVSGSREDVFDLIDEIGRALAREARAVRLPQGTIAVLAFDNQASPESAPFVSGIPQMLLTSLRQHPELTLVEPHEIDEAGAAVAGGAADEIGRWLGADATIRGVFTEQVRVQVEVRSTATQRTLVTLERRGTRSGLAPLAAELAQELAGIVGSHRRQTRTVAVLPFQNHDEARYDRFVKGIADMMTTSLGQTERFTVIERIQIETAMRNFNLEMSGPIDSETAVQVGAWLGADAVVLGSFLKFGGVFRIDARLIDAETGEVLAAESQRGTEAAVMDMVDDLGQELLGRYDEREPIAAVGTGSLEVVFRTTKTEMGERPVYHHICRLYVDGKHLGLSPVVERVGRWQPLFTQALRAGTHRVQVVHGYVQDGDWDGQMEEQPETFDVVIEAGSVSTVQYTYEVGWFKDRYVYEGTWASAAKE